MEDVKDIVKKRGVDAEWVLDARSALHALMAELDMAELINSGPEGARALALLASGVADAMAEERQKRGGARREDLASVLLQGEEMVPLIGRAAEHIIGAIEAGASRARRKGGSDAD